ncbi:Methyltransferase domain-containing protein [Chitinophaga eiseniae]|uniref:Methyltransferase domain-containing protein n=1 Tax=Chitinophaga eiseniae TaxID=634771 RepID=A0A1T4SNT2_9BACT|nr:class I SAM-dependent methyltransferase [Chitinophaga eiseniae]SKA29899.1 Methyltransferase domain-containing protein [Chitinophaga eiseniae]
MLEIGYGGYEDPNAGGESARMWKEWAPGLELTVVDIHQKENIPDGVRFVCGPQASLDTYYELNTRWDAIIDDGSHYNQDIIKTFELLWPVLESGGLYIVEDTHSSYDPYYADSCSIPVPKSSISTGTAMEYFTELAHQVNKAFFHEQYHQPYDIGFIHFYEDLIIIKKA